MIMTLSIDIVIISDIVKRGCLAETAPSVIYPLSEGEM
jgi:hypothetical protein